MCGVTLAAAFAAGRQNDELRTRNLITPLALGGTQRRQDSRPAEEQHHKQRPSTTTTTARAQERSEEERQQAKKREEAVGSNHEVVRRRIALQQSPQDLPRRVPADPQRQPHLLLDPKGCSRGQSCKHQHICVRCFGARPFDKCPINVESRAAYLKQRLVSVRFALRSHRSANRSQEEGDVGVPTDPAVLLPESSSVQAQNFSFVHFEGVGVGIPTPTTGVVSKRTVSACSVGAN